MTMNLTRGFASPEYKISAGSYRIPTVADLSPSGAKWLAEQIEARESGIASICEKPGKDGKKPLRIVAAIVYDSEHAPKMNQGDALRKLGLLPEGDIDSEKATDEEVAERLRLIIEGMAFMHTFISGTNKATDRLLLRQLQDFVLRDVIHFVPPNKDMNEMVDVSACFKGKKKIDRDSTLPKVDYVTDGATEKEAK